MAKPKPPDEKSIEVVFATYAALFARDLGKKLITYAPSQAKEQALAYDAKLIGPGRECRELYIQFKKASAYKYGFAFHPSNKPQLKTLKTQYPPQSAFYVSAAFPNDSALFYAQHKLGPAFFLDQYFAVDVQAFTDNSNSVRFNEDILHKKKSLGMYPNHGCGQTKKPIKRPLWLSGSELLCRFLGCDCRFISRGLPPRSSRPSLGSHIVVKNEQVFREALGIARESPNYRSWEVDTANEPVHMPGDEVNLMLRVFD